jgi:molecular chaperone HtpG
MFGQLPESYNLVVNSNHKLIGELLSEKDENKQNRRIKQFLDLALLSQGLLKGKDLTEFINRSVKMIKS